MLHKIKLIIANDQELFSQSLAALLNVQQEFDIVSEVSSGRELIEQLKQNYVDVVLLDTELPFIHGKSALEIIKSRFPAVKVIVLNYFSDTLRMSHYNSLGANGYLCTKCKLIDLIKAIKSVNSGGYCFDGNATKAPLKKGSVVKNNMHFVSEIKLNEREKEILYWICEGKTNKEIASYLHLSASTIDFHRTKIYGKTKCNNAVSLFRYALKLGMVSLS